METATVKFQEDFSRKADKFAGMSRDELIKEFMKFRGKAGKKTTYEENRRTREEVSRELKKELDKRFR